jgi:hypothetical protein
VAEGQADAEGLVDVGAEVVGDLGRPQAEGEVGAVGARRRRGEDEGEGEGGEGEGAEHGLSLSNLGATSKPPDHHAG